MLGLPRRWLRELTYLTLFVFLLMLMILFANYKKVIALQEYLPSDLIPSFFQPKDTYIIDVAIEDCYRLKKSNSCGVPRESFGRLGNLDGDGGWIKIQKDLILGNSWIKEQYFSYKNVKHEALYKNNKENKNSNEKRENLDGKNFKVIIDIAIAEPKSDSKIEGNDKLKFPEKIIKDFWASSVEGYEESADIKLYTEKKIETEDTKTKQATSKKETEETTNNQHIKDTKEDGNHDMKFSKRRELDRHDLVQRNNIPTKDDIKNLGWIYKSNGIWLKYGSPLDSNAITGIDILFGGDAVDPRPNWQLLINRPLTGLNTPSGKSAYISIRRGPRLNYKNKEYQPVLKFNKDGKFKILQVADLHFSTGFGKCRDPVPASSTKDCLADPRTLEFLDKVLDIEKPDLVVLTGDQIFGDESPDAETSVFKALNPFVKRKIPFAVTMGNHDDEGSLSRKEIMELSSSLPYSLASLGTEEVDGVGNYALSVEGTDSKDLAMTMYFLDTHKYSLNPKVTPGYDWIKKSQLRWLELIGDSFRSMMSKKNPHLSMAFFHIPLPEYRNLDQPLTGQNREGITAPRYNSGARSVLGDLGVQVVSVGHDHCNDYCLQDTIKLGDDKENKMWLCYGGGSGEGGYGGYNEFIRRLRIFELDTNKGEIKSWKRAQNDPNINFDFQVLVSEGNVVNK